MSLHRPVPTASASVNMARENRSRHGQGAAWLEREEREREERTDLLLRALDLKPGMVVADIGAGTGYIRAALRPPWPQAAKSSR
jgi:hypothetical protein